MLCEAEFTSFHSYFLYFGTVTLAHSSTLLLDLAPARCTSFEKFSFSDSPLKKQSLHVESTFNNEFW